MTQPMPRVLLVGFSERNKYFGNFFYATVHKLRNGFIRAGCHVVWFSDRDIADYNAPFRYRPLGRPSANAKLRQLVDTIRPDVICLMHADLIGTSTLDDIRRRHPAVKLVSVYLDPIAEGRFADRFTTAAEVSDVAFATTAGPTLAAHAHAGSVGFVPNPIDPSVERARSHAAAGHEFDFFFAGKPKGRDRVLADLKARLPARRFGFFLQTGTAMALGGAAYTRALGVSRIAIAAGIDVDYKWYASDRIAQYFGAGCLVAHPVYGQLETLYGDGAVVLFKDADDLAAQSEALLTGDAWRARAAQGQAQALAVSDTTIVARYIVDRARGEKTFDWPAWTAEFYVKRGAG
jgi:hypothetical protein